VIQIITSTNIAVLGFSDKNMYLRVAGMQRRASDCLHPLGDRIVNRILAARGAISLFMRKQSARFAPQLSSAPLRRRMGETFATFPEQAWFYSTRTAR
jgi:hypothetical protein